MRLLTRSLLALASLVVGWLPVVLVAILGWLTLTRLLVFLESPGMPVTFAYDSADGKTQVTVGGYNLDWESRRIRAVDVLVKDAKGKEALRANRLEAWLEGRAVHVKVDRASGSLERAPGGSLELGGLLPKAPQEQGEFGLTLALTQGDLIYQDRVVNQTVRAKLSNLMVALGDADLAARGSVSLDGSPDLKVTASAQGTGSARVLVQGNGFDAAPWMNLLESWLPKEAKVGWEGTRADNSSVTGWLRLDLAPNEAPDLASQFQFRAESLSVPGAISRWSGSGSGQLDDNILAVKAESVRPGARVTYDGAVSLWPLKAAGRVVLKGSGPRSLWPELARLLPKEAQFEGGEFDGVIRWTPRLEVRGSVSGRALSYGPDRVAGARGVAAFDGERVTAVLNQGTVYQRPASGWVDWRLKSDQIRAWLASPSGPVAPALARAGQKGFDGEGAMEGALKGTSRKPLFTANALLEGRYKADALDQPIRISEASVRLEADAQGASVRRASAITPSGLASVAGTLDWKGKMDLFVEASNLRVASFLPGSKGTGFVQGRIHGTAARPEFGGSFEGYSLAYQGREAIWLKGGIDFDGESLIASELRGQSGSGQLTGFVAWNTKTDVLRGGFTGENLFTTDWIPADVTGTFDLIDGIVAGTGQSPLITARLRGSRMVAYGVKAEGLEGQLAVTRDGVRVEGLKALVGDGQGEGVLSYLFAEGRAAGEFTFEGIPLSRLPVPSEVVLLKGAVSGKATVSGTEEEGYRAESEAVIRDLEANTVAIGSGTAKLSFAGDKLLASAEVGSLERFITLRKLDLDLAKRTVEAEGDVLSFELSSLAKALQPAWRDQPIRVQEAIRNTEGLMSGVIAVNGSLDNPDLDLQKGTVSSLEVFGREAGLLSFEGGKKGTTWTLPKLEWLSEDTVLSAKRASYNEKDGLDLYLELNKLDLTWLERFSPDLPSLSGTANLTFVGSGPLDNLDFQASLLAQDARVVGTDGKPLTLFDELNLFEIILAEGRLQASGKATLRGIDGDLALTGPLGAFLGEEEAEEGKITLDFKPQDLGFVKEYIPGIERVEGQFFGQATLTGKGSRWVPEALLSARGPGVFFPNSPQEVREFSLDLSLKNQAATAKGWLTGAPGWRIDVLDLQALLPTLLEPGTTVTDLLEDSQLSGSVKLKDFVLRQPAGEGAAPSSATLNGEVILGGSLAQSTIGGGIAATRGELILPNAFKEQAAGAPLPYEPTFRDFALTVGSGTPIRFGLGVLEVGGQGSVSGPLSALNLRMPLNVSRGQLRLPNSRIRLQEGSSVDVIWRGDAGAALQVLVDLEGQTNVTARRSAESYENYNVNLNFQGDLLNPAGLRITATADPGDLTSEEILSILGQRELVEALAASAFQRQGTAALRDPLYQIGLPSLTDPFTAKIAQALRLDYLSLDYNPFDQALTRFGKSLGGGFTIQGWRQLSEPQFGPSKYDLRLAYRLPSFGRYLDRIRVGLGTTHDRPWRLTIDWGRRW